MSYPTAYTYTIYQDGGAVKCRNNKTSVVTSKANLDPLITTILASGDPSFEVQSGIYDLHSSFAGWSVASHMNAYIHTNTRINVPAGYTGTVWNFNPAQNTVLYNAYLRGGVYDEQGTQENNWDCIGIAPADATDPDFPGAVYASQISNIRVWRCGKPLYLHTTGRSWINQMRFIDIYSEACKYDVYFEHTGTFTADQSGCNNNYFEDCSIQSTATDPTNHYPQTQGGIVNVNGDRNMFLHCNVWDIWKNSSAPSMTISTNAKSTKGIGGILTVQNYSDSGTKTHVDDQWSGLSTKNPVSVYDQLNLYGNTDTLEGWQPALNVSRVTDGGFEMVASFSTNGSSDALTVENGTNASGSFNPIWRAMAVSANSPYTIEAFHLGAYIKNAIDTGNVPAIKVAARLQSTPFTLSNRPMFGVSNYNTDEYLFYHDRVDMRNNQIVNAVMGNLYYKRNPQTTTYTTVENDVVIPCSAASGAFSVTLLSAASKGGKIYIFKKTDTTSNIVTLDGASSETIEGLPTWELRNPGDWVKIISDGTNWNVIDTTKIEQLAIRRTGTLAPNRYYMAGVVSQAALATAAAVTANTLYAMPFTVDRVQTIDSVGVNLTTRESSSNVRMGIYKDLNGVPDALLADLGTVGITNPIGLKEVTGLMQKLQPGIYWLTAVFSHTPTISFVDAAAISSIFGVSSSAAVNTGINASHTYGALPLTYPTIVVSTATSQPAFFYHFLG